METENNEQAQLIVPCRFSITVAVDGALRHMVYMGKWMAVRLKAKGWKNKDLNFAIFDEVRNVVLIFREESDAEEYAKKHMNMASGRHQ